MSRNTAHRILAGASLAALLAAAPAWAQAPSSTPAAAAPTPPRPSNDPTEFLRDPPKPASVKGQFSLVAIGDLLYSRPMVNHPNPEFQKVVELIKSGDVTVSNQEGVFIHLDKFKGEAAGNGLLWGEGTLAKDMKAMGVDMVSVANNHSTDFGTAGLLDSMALLDEAGVKHSGGGRNMQEARRAGFFDTPKGRVALVSTASSFKPNATANDAFGEIPARPGISTLRLRKVNLVTPDQMATIRKLATERATPLAPPPPADARDVQFGGEIYRINTTGRPDRLSWEMDLYDHAALLKSVREAKAQSDLTVFTIHAHESTTGFDDDTPPPPDFLIKLFRDTVDAGADVVVGGGPHSLRGIEIYKGRPIFYGVGVFFIKGEIKGLQESSFRVFPDETGRAPPPKPAERSVRAGGNPASWYDSIVAITDYENGKPTAVRLYPLDVGNTYDRSRRGNPHFADPENAKRILAFLQEASAPFGTKIEIDGSVGVIRIP
ncbi:MAG: CapA family protein [Phenylobacterium sp.]|nr:CapA family protein [Phenylobacterium sp.]